MGSQSNAILAPCPMELPMTTTLRAATREDVPLILEFIRALAEYEKLLDQVVVFEKSLV